MRLRNLLVILCLLSNSFGWQAFGQQSDKSLPQLLDKAGVKGGLIVCIGFNDPELLTSLQRSSAYVVQGLDTAPDRVERARAVLRAEGVYGPVSVQHWEGPKLPYVDNLVNVLVVTANTENVTPKEIERVLAPRGVVISNLRLPLSELIFEEVDDAYQWTKPVPDAIDDWSHFLHGADNNAIAADEMVGPPRHIQWRANPQWGRDHHAEKSGNPTVRTVVSAGGRLFMLTDEIETSNMAVPAKWTVTARDAFSGVLLWTTSIGTQDYRNDLPGIWRRLVVDDQRVYTAFGSDRMLKALDAGTGEPVVTYPGTEGVDELVEASGTLFVLLQTDTLLALRADSGEQLWRWQPKAGETVAPLTLGAADGKVFLKTGQVLCCLSARNGETLYRTNLPGATKQEDTLLQGTVFYPGKLVVGDGVVLCTYAAQSPAILRGWNRTDSRVLGSSGVGGHRLVSQYGGKLGAFSASDGKLLWETEYLPHLAMGPGEIYLRDGLAWIGPLFDKPRDLHTGEVKAVRPIVDMLWTDGHHYRCYPGKATSEYIITAKRGTELIDLDGENHSRNNWVRGACQVGITPCNGLLYAPPHSCGCYMETKLFGFWALAGRRATQEQEMEDTATLPEKGPAYADVQGMKTPAPSMGWWTYRGGNARGGSSALGVGNDLKQRWKTQLGGRLTAATVADGRVFVAQIDAHVLHAIDSDSGKKQWSYTAGGRIDSPPTVVDGAVLFGCRDGYAYCLRTDDGALVWRYRVAPALLQTMAFNQPESVWPVHGSVLYQDGTVYAAAGRSSYLDGGIRLVGLDPISGELRLEKLIRNEHVGALPLPEHADETVRYNQQNWMDYKTDLAPDRSDSFSMEGARPAILVGEDDSVYMRQKRFSSQLEEMETVLPHLFSTSELLDGWEHNRAYWALGTGNFSSLPVAYPWLINKGAINVPAGLMMAFDDHTVWTVMRGASGYTVIAAGRPAKEDAQNSLPDFRGEREGYEAVWSHNLEIRPRSMLQVGDTLVFGGMAKEQDGNPYSAAAQENGNHELGRLQILSSKDGSILCERTIGSPPVWDGMAVAEDGLFIPCVDGSVVSFGQSGR
ncbi:MAG: PQQ-binding-like beta-propeller repeat protein [Phycisphaerales bacterium]|nr:PQQ-binding-like beta-propeller repeat protein [Phycisphaerales bacterium]